MAQDVHLFILQISRMIPTTRRTGDPEFELAGPDDEDDAIALSYTSGTTGNPKGVIAHHRGAALNSMNLSIT